MDALEDSCVLSANSVDEGETVAEIEISESLQNCEIEDHALPHVETEDWSRKEESEEERVKKMREEERERKRRDVMERIKRLSLSSCEADEPFSPLSPTLMISDRTESLSRSVKKSNSVKKTESPVTISKIDSRLEQYNHAVELSGQEAKDTKAVLMDLPTSPESVAARKSFFEEGDTWNQNQKVIFSKPNEVKSGEVKHKKNLWETLEKSSSSVETPGGKASSAKKFKFVETGHGKYEKVPLGESDKINHTNGKPSQ